MLFYQQPNVGYPLNLLPMRMSCELPDTVAGAIARELQHDQGFGVCHILCQSWPCLLQPTVTIPCMWVDNTRISRDDHADPRKLWTRQMVSGQPLIDHFCEPHAYESSQDTAPRLCTSCMDSIYSSLSLGNPQPGSRYRTTPWDTGSFL